MALFLFYSFIFITAIQIFYYTFIFGKFSFEKEKNQGKSKTVRPISVIVCAKNESENIATLVPILVDQDYPNYEIVLIDDASNDNTRDLFENIEKKYPNIRIVNVENNEAFWDNKKYSLTLGIKAAKNDYLLFIEPNCYPSSNQWIRSMCSKFTDKKTIILGYSGYEKVKKSFINKIIRFDSVLNTIQYFSWTKAKKPYTGKGQNLAYKKEVFFNANGFINHIKIKTGEDELFINEIATKKNTDICFNINSFTYSKAKNNYKKWCSDKLSSLDIVKHFKTVDILKLGIFQFSQFMFLSAALILLLLDHECPTVLIFIFIRYVVTFYTLWAAAKKLNEKEILFWYPIIEIIIVYTQVSIFILFIFSRIIKLINPFSKAPRWKLKNT